MPNYAHIYFYYKLIFPSHAHMIFISFLPNYAHKVLLFFAKLCSHLLKIIMRYFGEFLNIVAWMHKKHKEFAKKSFLLFCVDQVWNSKVLVSGIENPINQWRIFARVALRVKLNFALLSAMRKSLLSFSKGFVKTKSSGED